MFSAALFFGFYNSSSILQYVVIERSVVYREKFARMYAPCSYALAQVLIEIPYIFIQVISFTAITYPMVGFYWTGYKVFWYTYSMFCTLLYLTYFGMLMVSVTPNYPVAAIILTAFFNVFYLFSGFLIPEPQIPTWWKWLYYLNPTSWTLKGMLVSQYGDIVQNTLVFGKNITVTGFLTEYFTFHHHDLPIIAIMLVLYPIVFAWLFVFFISKLHFQKR
ncbi:OLC1v1008345C1 [Oldenlandia corymbosa var. corymbosa]|uniref:OLC1v1008345C1 n=1 Tax=Oldenlandia corymbosa var. corymbosa TaxID=529605 RepID=A0AAV1DLX4_OLDCO|nr:OLC1v1008345C1 [Oldenlandia corymbosa var. corymbosa]